MNYKTHEIYLLLNSRLNIHVKCIFKLIIFDIKIVYIIIYYLFIKHYIYNRRIQYYNNICIFFIY